MRSELVQCGPSNVGLVKPNANSMLDVKIVYRYVRKKRLVTVVRRLLAPPTPDLSVEVTWLKGSGSEVRKKRPVYVRAIIVPKRRFNIGLESALTGKRIDQCRLAFSNLYMTLPHVLSLIEFQLMQ